MCYASSHVRLGCGNKRTRSLPQGEQHGMGAMAWLQRGGWFMTGKCSGLFLFFSCFLFLSVWFRFHGFFPLFFPISLFMAFRYIISLATGKSWASEHLSTGSAGLISGHGCHFSAYVYTLCRGFKLTMIRRLLLDYIYSSLGFFYFCTHMHVSCPRVKFSLDTFVSPGTHDTCQASRQPYSVRPRRPHMRRQTGSLQMTHFRSS